jgi:hypothetical protein
MQIFQAAKPPDCSAMPANNITSIIAIIKRVTYKHIGDLENPNDTHQFPQCTKANPLGAQSNPHSTRPFPLGDLLNPQCTQTNPRGDKDNPLGDRPFPIKEQVNP